MKPARILLPLLFSVMLGIAIAGYRLFNFENSPAFFKNGNWMGTTNLPLGKDPLLTAQVTLFALFALPSEEAIYLFGKRDDKDDILTGKNDYEIIGNVNRIKAGYWSITAYGKDLFLVPNKSRRYSFNGSNLETDSVGNFKIMLSSSPKPGNWLPVPAKGKFSLVLRVYMGEQQFLKELSTTPLPSIKIINRQ